jgi:hypothetical protein
VASTAKRGPLILVDFHNLGHPAPELKRLKENTRLLGEDRYDNASVLYFAPIEGSTIFESPEPCLQCRPSYLLLLVVLKLLIGDRCGDGRPRPHRTRI